MYIYTLFIYILEKFNSIKVKWCWILRLGLCLVIYILTFVSSHINNISSCQCNSLVSCPLSASCHQKSLYQNHITALLRETKNTFKSKIKIRHCGSNAKKNQNKGFNHLH